MITASVLALALLIPSLPALAQGTEVDRVAIVTPASRTNQGWDQQGVDHLTAVGAELGIEVEVVENAGYDDITPILDDLAGDGADLIVCHASGYQTVCPGFAAESGVPVVVIENPGAVEAGLVSDIETQAQEAAYLAGVTAGLETRTGAVAIVVSGEPPTWNFMTVGFAEGLHSVRPDAKLLYQVIGEAAYDDAPNAKRSTETVIAAGADIVFGMGDGASFGMIQAIREHNEGRPAGQQVRFIDVIGDKSGSDAGEFLLTSVLFDYRDAYRTMIRCVQEGEFGTVYTMSLENQGVRLLELPDTVADRTVARVEETRQRIIAGEIAVSSIGDAEGVDRRLEELFPG
jgi:simple sugar transport system substrate-binding protein